VTGAATYEDLCTVHVWHEMEVLRLRGGRGQEIARHLTDVCRQLCRRAR